MERKKNLAMAITSAFILSSSFSGCAKTVEKVYVERPLPAMKIYKTDVDFDLHAEENSTSVIMKIDDFYNFISKVKDMKKAYLKYEYQTAEYLNLRRRTNAKLRKHNDSNL